MKCCEYAPRTLIKPNIVVPVCPENQIILEMLQKTYLQSFFGSGHLSSGVIMNFYARLCSQMTPTLKSYCNKHDNFCQCNQKRVNSTRFLAKLKPTGPSYPFRSCWYVTHTFCCTTGLPNSGWKTRPKQQSGSVTH